MTNNIIKALARNRFNELNSDKQFNASDGWCTSFKKKWNLSTLTVKPSKKASNHSSIDVKKFLTNYKRSSKGVPNKFIFNYDETNIKVMNPPKTAIRIKGSTDVKVECEGNTKENFTIGLTISAGGALLKPLIIAKGMTERCLNKFSLSNKVNGTYTDNGWANEDCIVIILDQIANITNGEKGILLLDQHASHTTDKVKKHAKDNNIKLIYIPVGMTSKYQPLDQKVNGILKKYMTQSYSQKLATDHTIKYSHANCLNDLVINIKKIKKGIIMRSFDCLIDQK